MKNEKQTLTNLDWLALAQRIQAIAQTGLHFSEGSYDRERYEELSELSVAIMQKISDQPIEKIERMFASERDGYSTPKVDIRAVVFDQRNRILMVQERADGCWSLPGGWADIGKTPKEIAVKEVYEEAGLEVSATRVLGIFDKRCHAHPPEPWYVYKIFILCSVTGGSLRAESTETTGADWFPENALPPLSLTRNTESQVVSMFRLRENSAAEVYCD